jgi:predicted NUDIX family NTP pyrophosphohydrolase
VSTRRSAGILLFRRRGDSVEVLLGHPGGPFFARQDLGSWSIPKGEPGPEETDLSATARREFEEETGHRVPDVRLIDLGTITQRGGKVVHAWAAEGDLDPATASSNTFSFEWPPFSGKIRTYPEIDRVEWYDPAEARRRIKAAQVPLIERLEAALGGDEPQP